MMRSHMAASSITGRLSSVSTPPGSTLLQIPCGARRFATFFVYERMPPWLAAYSGNSEPVCPLAEPTLTTERIHGAGFGSLVNTKEELAAICQAIEAAGRKVGQDIYLVGVDALEEAVQAVADGRMTGTVLNDDVSQAQTAVDAAIRYVKGEANEKNYTIDYVNVTPENAADYIK